MGFFQLRASGRAAPMALLVTAALLAAMVPAAEAQDEEVEWAVKAPLAPRSLLLDVAVADGRLVAVGERGHVLISDDIGATWRQAEVPTRSTLTGVFFLDRERGWVVGHDAVILRTLDGGATWERVHWAPDDETPLFDVWFRGPEEGFALGAYGSWYVTVDGGESWELDAISEDDSHLHRIAREADGRLYIAAERGMLYRSDDGGDSWEELPSPYEGSFFGVLPLGGEVVLAFGLRGHLYRSEDGGESWTELETGTTAMLTDGVVREDGTVVVVGLSGTVLVSVDGGRSFVQRPVQDRRGIAAVADVGGDALALVGEFGVRTESIDELRATAGAGGGEAAR